MKLHPEHVAPDNAMGFMSDDGGETDNRCHFWYNFDIADMKLLAGARVHGLFRVPRFEGRVLL